MSTFIYIQNVDCGLAPCVHRGVWSLALCKPAIRRRAAKGDVVIAVSPKRDGHRLSSWARLDEPVSTADFFTQYPKTRPDNIYQLTAKGHFLRHSKVKHKLHQSDGDLSHDLGKGGKNARVLVSSDFYCFGKDAVPLEQWTKDRKALRRVMDALGRATRRYFNDAVEDDLKHLKCFLRTNQSRHHNRPFVPREPALDLPCGSEKDDKKYSVCNPSKKKR